MMMGAEVILVIHLAVFGTWIFRRFITEQCFALWIAGRSAKWMGVLSCTLLMGTILGGRGLCCFQSDCL